MRGRVKTTGFTIVELLIVIVVIGILAAITIVSYNGIQGRAVAASLQSDLDNASKQLKLDQVIGSGYPTTLALANGGKGVSASPGTTFQYAVNNTASPQTFCITATKNNQVYRVAGDGVPTPGDCLDSYGLILDLDAGNPASYPGTGTTWTDLSGSGNNGTLMNGVAYSAANGGALSFDGTDDYVQLPGTGSTSSFTIGVWFKSLGDSLVNAKGYNTLIGSGGANRLLYSLVGTSMLAQMGRGNHNASILLPGSTWGYVIYSYDGSTASSTWFINGAQNTSLSGSITLNQPVKIGSYDTFNYMMNGLISSVRVYNRELSAAEANQNFNTLRGRYGI
ncbi:prepilin-type N-terminal cleavage/methylation domain-containing protein [Candidatus Saccharibacteria bacterium]|nr:prepilin-type N-terminal cleavage/methylation domain-containing protein [Candidatus Saccharibacteria bacterium]